MQCNFCRRKGHTEKRCWDKTPSLTTSRIPDKNRKTDQALISEIQKNELEESYEESICLIAQSE